MLYDFYAFLVLVTRAVPAARARLHGHALDRDRVALEALHRRRVGLASDHRNEPGVFAVQLRPARGVPNRRRALALPILYVHPPLAERVRNHRRRQTRGFTADRIEARAVPDPFAADFARERVDFGGGGGRARARPVASARDGARGRARGRAGDGAGHRSSESRGRRWARVGAAACEAFYP